MPQFLIGCHCEVMLSADELYVFSLPRSMFDKLPGFEADRIDVMTGLRFWYKLGSLTSGLDVTFYCKETPVAKTLTSNPLPMGEEGCPARSATDSALSPHEHESAVERTG